MRGFAGPDRLDVGARYHLDIHFRNFTEAEDRIFGPGIAGDARRVESEPLLRDPTGGLDRATFDLIDHAIRIDGFADIDCNREPLDGDFFRALDLGDHGAISAGSFIPGKTETMTDALAPCGLPAGAPC